MDQHTDIRELTEHLLNALDARSRDIISRRYGIKGDKRETLESIGREYGITRERVRQIESHTKKTLASLKEEVRPAVDKLDDVFRQFGGMMAEDHVVEVVASDPNVIRFYLHILPEYTYVSHNKHFAPHWTHAKHSHERGEELVKCACEILDTAKQPIDEEELVDSIQERVGDFDELSEDYVVAALIASRDLARSVFDRWGKLEWAEVSPRGVGDKAYAVLRRKTKPAHFREIADLINEAHFDAKTANAQTVHNELIKDDRFVLVGRGLYGLKEWGFVPGTVADVLESVLRRAGRPMTREELIEEVMKQRMVKKNTILLGLQNNKKFVRAEGNRYGLAE